MRPDDERPEDAAADEVEDESASKPPRPATWAGRRRAGAEPEGGADEPEGGADEPQAADGELAAEVVTGGSDPAATREFDPLAGEPEEASHGHDVAEGKPTDEGKPAAEDEPADADAREPADHEEPAGEEEPPEEEEPTEAEEPADADAQEPADHEEPAGEDHAGDATDAALAGLRARTAEHQPRVETSEGDPMPGDTGAAEPVPAGVGPSPPPQAAVAEGDGEGGKAPHAKRIWARFLAASLVIVISMAAATSISLLVYLTDIAKGLSDNDALASLRDQLADVDGGSPQTILILGSDKRLDTKGDPGRSDTTLLLRVDPDKDRIALLSIPRDLKVTIPNYGVGKFNEAYTVGGPKLTTRVVKQLTGVEINHVVNINFTGFADAVDAIGGVYVDVDRQYYVPEGSDYAAIDPPIDAGYQLMKGLKALQYVRFRHDDNDLVRSARQQDFLREARQKLPPGTLVRERNELLDIFTEYTTSDIGEAVPLLELLKTFASVQSAPVVEVHFPADLGDGTDTYVTASDGAIKDTVAQFLATEGTPGERPAGQASEPEKPEKPQGANPDAQQGKSQGDDHFEGPPMDDATAIGQQYAKQIAEAKRKDGDPMVDFPIYYPTRLHPGSTLDDYSRAFPIDGPGDDAYHGYKMVAEFFGGGYTEYYGVSGTDWVDAPILANPSETRTIDGREYLLFYDGDRLRQVGWKTSRGAYWVNNSLLQALDEGEMLSIATSMRELDK